MAQSPRLLGYAKQMRREATPFEALLWRHLSRSQLGYKFRRQHVVGDHILDFFCPAKALAVEVDGNTHSTEKATARDGCLAKLGITVLHVTNEEVATNVEGVLMAILEKLQCSPDRWHRPHPNPSPKGEGLQKSNS